MKQLVQKSLQNPLLHMLVGGVFAHLAFTAVILMTLELPPELILESGLREVLHIFED